jgi:hypothetical protein
MHRVAKSSLSLVVGSFVLAASVASAQTPVECAGSVRQSKSVTLTGSPTPITAIYPSLQFLLRTSFSTATDTCLVAHFSALSRIADNQVYYQVLLDGVPMLGHAPAAGPAIVYNALDDNGIVDNHEQDSDPVKDTSFNFFARLPAGNHEVRVFVAAGSGIDFATPNLPTVQIPVLTLVF